MTKGKPKYKHDCERCVFLGAYKDADLYFCDQYINSPTLVARFSNDGPDYISGLDLPSPFLDEARKRARKAVLI